MKINKNIIFITLSTVTIFALSGCGGGDYSTTSGTSDPQTQTTPVSAESSDVQVIDGYVIGATVTALNNPNCSTVTGAKGKATLLCKAEGFKSIGGKIDLNSNGIADTNEPDAPTMIAPTGYSMATPLTTLIATGKVSAQQIANVLGTTVDEILSDPYETKNIDIAKAYNLAAVTLFLNAADKMVDKIVEASNSMTNEQPTTTDVPIAQLEPPSIEEHLLPTFNVNLELFTVLVKNVLTETANENDITAYSIYVDSISTSEATTPIELDNEISQSIEDLKIGLLMTTTDNQTNSSETSDTTNSSVSVDLLPTF